MPEAVIQQVAGLVQAELGLLLFGFDLIMDAEGGPCQQHDDFPAWCVMLYQRGLDSAASKACTVDDCSQGFVCLNPFTQCAFAMQAVCTSSM